MSMIYMGCFQADTCPRSKSEKGMTIWCSVRWEMGLYCQEDFWWQEQRVKDARRILESNFRQVGREHKQGRRGI